MSVLRTRSFVSAGATMALAVVGLVAPAMSAAAAPSVTVDPVKPAAGQSFTVTMDGLTAGQSYRLALASGGQADTADKADSNSCSTLMAAAAAKVTCTVTESTAGAYSLNLVDANGTSVSSGAVTVAPVVAGMTAPKLTDRAGTTDFVTVHANPNVTYTVQGNAVAFAANETFKDVAITPTSGKDSTDVVVVSTATNGYVFADGSTTQTSTMRTMNTATSSTPIVVAEPTRTDAVGKADDTITLRKTPNVSWTINGSPVTFGDATSITLPVTGTRDDKGVAKVDLKATAADGYVLEGGAIDRTYSYEFSDQRAEPTITRVQGANRFDTSVEIAKKYFPGTRDEVFVANGMNFPDALAAGPAAARAEVPLMLAAKDSVQQNVLDEIRRMAPKKITVVGGPAVVSPAVEAELAKIATVERVAGDTRFETAVAVSKRWAPFAANTGTVYLASGLNFPDALSGGSGAAKEGAPMLLTDGKSLTDETVVELRRLKPKKVVIVGGANVVSAAVAKSVGDAVAGVEVVRAAGDTRYETSAMIIENVTGKPANEMTSVFLTTGQNYPDALAGIPAAHVAKAPLALTTPTCLPTAVKAELDKLPLTGTVRLGSTNIVGDFSVLTGGC